MDLLSLAFRLVLMWAWAPLPGGAPPLTSPPSAAASPSGASPSNELVAAPAAAAVQRSDPENGAQAAPLVAPAPRLSPPDGLPALPQPAHPSISGNSVGARFGFAGGGDTLVSATLSDGSQRTITAGAGAMLAIAVTATPFWVSQAVGFGAGAELGWKGQEISASNGRISFNRFPLVATLHLLLRGGLRSYFVVAAGAQKDLGISLSGTGVPDVRINSAIGGAGSLAYLYSLTPAFALDATLRFAKLHYDLSNSSGGTTRLDASSGSFAMGVSYQF